MADQNMVTFSINDCRATALCQLPTQTWCLFGIFNRHNGPQTIVFLAKNLIETVIGALTDLFSKHKPIPEEHTKLGTISGCPTHPLGPLTTP
jgi:pyruvate dehydrogenase phosphatase